MNYNDLKKLRKYNTKEWQYLESESAYREKQQKKDRNVMIAGIIFLAILLVVAYYLLP